MGVLQVQNFTLLLIELHEVPVSSFLPLKGSMTLWCISHSSLFSVISKFAEGTLSPIIQIINEDTKQDWMQ